MTDITANNIISGLIYSEAPEYIKTNFPNFIAFLEAYYEYLEQGNTAWNSANTVSQGKLTQRSKTFLENMDIDTTIDAFAQKLYNQFLADFPENTLANRSLLLKHIKDFYRAKGTQKSYRFLFRVLFNKEIDFFYPKNYIFKTDSAIWNIPKSLIITDLQVNSEANSNASLLINTRVTGNVSGASATINSIDSYYLLGSLVNEIFLYNNDGVFANTETISTTDRFLNNISATVLSWNTYPGRYMDDSSRLDSYSFIQSEYYQNFSYVIQVQESIASYTSYLKDLVHPSGTLLFGEYVLESVVQSTIQETGAYVVVTSNNLTNISNVGIIKSGAGFLVGDYLTFYNSPGQNANGVVIQLDGAANNYWHANTFNINSDLISPYANINVNSTDYTFPNYANANQNTVITNALSFFVYGPCGPMANIFMNNSGKNYVTIPTVNVLGNTLVQSLGILGKLEVGNNAGANYKVGDPIAFTNPPGYYGFGANAQVSQINSTGAIIHCQFLPSGNGLPPGGFGYDPSNLPTAYIVSANGKNANIQATAILAYGIPDVQLEAFPNTNYIIVV